MHCFHSALIKGPAVLHWKLWVVQIPLTFPPEIPTCVGIYSDVEGELQVLRYNGTHVTFTHHGTVSVCLIQKVNLKRFSFSMIFIHSRTVCI